MISDDASGASRTTTGLISAHVAALRGRLLASIAGSALAEAELLNPPGSGVHARFLAFRTPKAEEWKRRLDADEVIVDTRGDVLRIGLGLYHDGRDVARLAAALRRLA